MERSRTRKAETFDFVAVDMGRLAAFIDLGCFQLRRVKP
jgi:hypothetical protein